MTDTRPAIFLDKDGTLLDDVPWNLNPRTMRLAPGAHDTLRLFASFGLPMFVISNQSGVALGKFDLQALSAVEARLRELAAEAGATLAGIYWCPHHPEGTVPAYTRACDCRKPAPGMLLRAAREHRIDLARSWFVGDILDDIEAGHRAGCRAALVGNGNGTVGHRTSLRGPGLVAGNLFDIARAIAYETECAS